MGINWVRRRDERKPCISNLVAIWSSSTLPLQRPMHCRCAQFDQDLFGLWANGIRADFDQKKNLWSWVEPPENEICYRCNGKASKVATEFLYWIASEKLKEPFDDRLTDTYAVTHSQQRSRGALQMDKWENENGIIDPVAAAAARRISSIKCVQRLRADLLLREWSMMGLDVPCLWYCRQPTSDDHSIDSMNWAKSKDPGKSIITTITFI